MEFSPFNSNILAYSTDNNSVVMTSIKEENNSYQFKSMSYKNHNKKVSFINFNPIASNVICSCTTHGELHVWDTAKLRSFVEYNEVKFPNSISWSPNGSVIGISSKDKNFNIYDPRNNNISFTTRISQKFSNDKFAWIDNNSIATIGWDIQSNKILSLLDIRKSDNFYSSIIVNKKANQSNISNIFVNPELKLIYSVEKDEYNVGVFDYSQGILVKSLDFRCSEPNNFSISLNRRYLDKDRLELDRLIRYTKNKKIFYVSFTFKNLQNIDFDGVIYPKEELGKPQLTSDQWIAGKNAEILKQKFYVRRQLVNINDNKKIKDNKVLNENKINNQNKTIIPNEKQKINEPEIINEIKENKNTEILKELTEEKNKNKKLENELKEKNKTIENLEKEVNNLKNELDKQIEINKDCEDKIALYKITFDSKDETYKALLEKDKEIKEFKEKMKKISFRVE